MNSENPRRWSSQLQTPSKVRSSLFLVAGLSATVLGALAWTAWPPVSSSLPNQAHSPLPVSAPAPLAASPQNALAVLGSPQKSPLALSLATSGKAGPPGDGDESDGGGHRENGTPDGSIHHTERHEAPPVEDGIVSETEFALIPTENPNEGGFQQAGQPVQIPVLIQEALDPDDTGTDRPDGIATFGLPFPKGQLFETNGRPSLAVNGSETWQFRTLDKWTDGSVRWALVDLSADVLAGQVLPGLTVVDGSGQSSATPIAKVATNGKSITLKTGTLQATILRENFNFLYYVRANGKAVLGPTFGPSLYGFTPAGALLTPGPTTVVSIEENGPARAVVRADGPFVDAAGNSIIDFTCRITARAKSNDLEVTVTLRNASKDRPVHAQIERVEIVCRGRPGANRAVTVPQHTGAEFSKLLPPGKHLYLYQGQSDAKTDGVGSSKWLPHIPVADLSDKSTLVDQGYSIVSKWQTIHPLGDVTEWPELGWLDLTGTKGGVTLSIKNMPYLWPTSLEASGNALLTAGLWTSRNSASYTFVYQQHESRTALLSFHTASDGDPQAAARRLHAPLIGRAADYDVYDEAEVLPYRLLTLTEQAEAYALMGITHQVQATHPKREVTRFLYKGTTGGTNNSPHIETNMASHWLRHGYGGSYQNAMDLAIWKGEWQIKRSDDFIDKNAPAIINDDVPHTDGHQGDDEHRYRGGMVLAYYLSGDERIKDALYDEAEVLASVSLWPHERSMYQTLRAMSRVAEFTKDASLTQVLRERMDFISPPTVDVYTETSGYGWESAPLTGSRRYFAFSTQNNGEKPAGENFQARGFISASLGPTAFYHAARHLANQNPNDPRVDAALGRLTDLAFWTYNELYPWFADPEDRHIAYSYAITLKEVTIWEKWDFHPILMGMAEAYMHTGLPAFLFRGVHQIEAHQAHDNGPFASNLYLLDSRLEAQHFLSIYRDWALAQSGTDQP
ncbi:MAG: hypothetical protein ACI9EF_001764 [Pseudohongiellaceae bacterium]|jgi:hypothetical protein